MSSPVAFPYLTVPGPPPAARPLVPIRLSNGRRATTQLGLVDSGSDTSVLPYTLGLQLGPDWHAAIPLPPAGGILRNALTRSAILEGEVAHFPPARLAFAWVQRDDLPLILGQVNFFLEFDVCFFRSKGEFHLQPRTP